MVEKIEVAIGHFSVSCKFQNVLDQREWVFYGVYGPNVDRERLAMWEELVDLASWWISRGLLVVILMW